MRYLVVFALSVFSFAASGSAAESVPAPGSPWLHAQPEALRAWQEARLGMFVCWGPVTLTGQEIGWSRGGVRPEPGRAKGGPTPVDVYDNLYKKWKPEQFDAHAWIRTAQEAGARYMIFLVKHHDGFCLYDTRLTDYRSTSPEAAWQHDATADIARACHEAGLALWIYYSQPDWHHPDYRTENHARYIQYLHGQVRELLSNYGQVEGLWFDGLGGKAQDWDAENLFRLARGLQPHLLINNRCGLPADFDTPEQRVGRFQVERPWESCITLGTQWSWKPDDRIKSLKECIDILVTCAGGGGNLALNTNPMPDGQIEPRQVERFRQIGQWLRQYGQSIYGTRGGPFWGLPWGVATRKDHSIYVHVLRWPEQDRLTLPSLNARIVGSKLLTGGRVEVRQTGEAIELSVPPEDRRELDTIVVLELDVPADALPARKCSPVNLAAGKKATASNVFQRMERYGPDKAVDDDTATRWGCDSGTHAAWLEVDLGAPATFDRARISEPYGRVQEFQLERKEGDRWTVFHRGQTIGQDCEVRFAPVTARYVRLNLLKTSEGPSIWEFQLYAPAERVPAR